MTSPITFPDWMPWWAQLLILIIAILIGLAFALMPFSVFGVKSRLDVLEARLDEIQGEIRMLALRLPEPGRRGSFEEEPMVQASAVRPVPAAARPPIPPAAWAPDSGPRRPIGGAAPADQRTEPGLYRPAPPIGRTEPRIDRGR